MRPSAARAETIIREAVARAVYDMAEKDFEGFSRLWGGRDGCGELASRIARDLELSGWRLKPGVGRDQRMSLEDHIMFAVDFATRKEVLADLAHADRGRAGTARDIVAGKICETLNLAKVVLVRRRSK